MNKTTTARMLAFIAILAAACFMTLMVFQVAWMSDDGLITLRYVEHLLNGYGPVYNVGERVLGYTHPLWFACVACCSLFFGQPLVVAMGLGVLFTFVTLLTLGVFLYRSTGHAWKSFWVLGLTTLLFATSDAWLSFQTSGLENSLTHLLLLFVVSESVLHDLKRPPLLLFLLTLLCLNRPDCLFIALPIGVLALKRIQIKELPWVMAALAPGFLWLLFSWLYYGSPLPNTGAAKLGNYPNQWDSVAQGLLYLQDWFNHETLACCGALTFFLIALCFERSAGVRALALGIVLQVLWVLWIGGDFMRGRFLMVTFSASLFLGGLIITRIKAKRLVFSLTTLLSILFLGVGYFGPNKETLKSGARPLPASGIVNERLFYKGYTLQHYQQFGSFDLGVLSTEVEALRNYTTSCGPIALHLRNPGTLGYFSGSKVTIIDALGLTDRFIAKLPRANLINPSPRPGHPDKYIPLEYLAKRGDISLHSNWWQRLKDLDCSLKNSPLQFQQTNLFMARNHQIVALSLAK